MEIINFTQNHIKQKLVAELCV